VNLIVDGGFLLDPHALSGYEVLDEALGGGFPKGSLILVAGGAGNW